MNRTLSAPFELNPAVTHRRRSAAAAGVVLGLAVLSVLVINMRPLELYAAVLAMVALCFGPAYVDWRLGRLDVFEPVHLLGVLYFVNFGIGSVWAYNDPKVPYDIHLIPFVPRAATYCAIGYAALLIGYYLPFSRPYRIERPGLVPRGSLVMAIPAILGFVGFVASRFPGLPPALLSLAQLTPLFLFAWMMGWLTFLSGRASRAQKLFLFAIMLPQVLLLMRLFLGNKSLVVILVGFPLAAFWYTKGKLPWRTLTAFTLVFFFFVFPFYNTYRSVDDNLDQSTRVDLTMNRISSHSAESYIEFSWSMVKRRLSMVSSVAVVIRDVGRWVPYASGKTIFEPFFVYIIPRVIWPDKPKMAAGQEFGRQFRVTSARNTETHIGPTLPGELYWNFGAIGLVSGLALWGAALRLFHRVLAAQGIRSIVFLSIYFAVLIRMLFFGGQMGSELVNILRTLLILVAFCWWSRRVGLLVEQEPAKAGP